MTYRNNIKNRDFGKEDPQNCYSEQLQGARENRNCEVNPTRPKTDSVYCFGISNLPNILSISRFFLCFIFLSQSMAVRLLAICLAAGTDFLDGYLARRFGWISKIGTTIDPLSDKFFVFIGLLVFWQEGALNTKEALLMLSRDAAVIFFGFVILFLGKFNQYAIHAIFFGKVTTTLQMLAFIALTLEITIPAPVFFLFGFLGLLSLFELFFDDLLAKRDHIRIDSFKKK